MKYKKACLKKKGPKTKQILESYKNVQRIARLIRSGHIAGTFNLSDTRFGSLRNTFSLLKNLLKEIMPCNLGIFIN